jgi:Family of unknown function (DUF6361)
VSSLIAWLDASREDQRRMREIVNLFSQSESRDELGIGQVRDAFSDTLFPGTSTLQTRARYLLFVPWCFMMAAAEGGVASRGERHVEKNERALIVGLRDAGATDGLIGRLAGVAVKNLPSTIYWSALQRYGILRVAEPLDALGLQAALDPDQEELAERVLGAWSPTLPSAPAGSPRHLQAGFDLSRTEAGWLQERMLGSTEGTLLHHLVRDGNRPQPGSDAPWDDPVCHTSPSEVRKVLEHARQFSLAMHGASFLYNLMIAELYVDAGHTRIENPVERYRDRLQEWVHECALNASALATWDRDAFWQLILGANPQVSLFTRGFLNAWFDKVGSLEISQAADDETLRQLITRRERTQKGSQSRLTNDRLLASCSGESGTRRLTYRWEQVNRIVQDLHDGLEEDSAAA